MSTKPSPKRHSADVLVVGSGPGGAVAAATLASAGRDVLVVEEGEDLPQASAPAFSYAEMASKYRSAGMTVALGNPSVAYAEGRCVGGGSEVNSGLYHRLDDASIRSWATIFQVDDMSPAAMQPHFEACEAVMQPATYPGKQPGASAILRSGAAALNIESGDIPRLVKFRDERDAEGVAVSDRHSMQESFLQTFRKQGRLLSQTRVRHLRAKGASAWEATAVNALGEQVIIEANAVFVCAGAIHTPALLRRSGIRTNVGNSLSLQPMVKLTAEFADTVNFTGMGIAAEQVKAFSPAYSFGCSVSSVPHLALNLLAVDDGPVLAQEHFANLISYYVMSQGTASGSVRALPGLREPLVRYRVSNEEFQNLARGIKSLAHLLLEAGARRVFTGTRELPVVSTAAELDALPDMLKPRSCNVVTVHLMASCPMGENRSFAAVNSWGKVHDHAGLYVADASLFCSSPGLNPQGTVMALARRNAMHYLGTT